MRFLIMMRRSPAVVTLGCVLLMVAGGLLLWLPIHTQLALDDWETELRAGGLPARAVVYDQVTDARSKSTMYFRYEVSGRTYEQEVPCVEVCRPAGDDVSIWVNRADPKDFVTDFGELSGHRGRFQGLLGAGGFVVLVAAILLLLSRIPFGRWFPPRTTPRRRPAAQVSDGTDFTSRSKRKRSGRR
ncbi:DUF3592 domain-containing protein [Micromonospora sp. CPCC 205539]|uniref:DUF3592 domain-containing protein n=1 Tax=Micromonospora sp. CPCC 205539 TaxID=3122408 RepID=UPI002FF1CF16